MSAAMTEALARSLAPYRNQPGIAIARDQASLEDVFIDLQEDAK